MTAKRLKYYEYDREQTVCCPCGWSGICGDHEDYFRELLDVCCVNCERMLLIVPYPTFAETRTAAAAGNSEAQAELEHVVKREEFLARFEESKLAGPEELPDLEGEELIIEWDLEEKDDVSDSRTVLRHGEQVLWREVAIYEGSERFGEIFEILYRRYGRRLKELHPTSRSEIYLYGDSISSSGYVKGLNDRLKQSHPEITGRCHPR